MNLFYYPLYLILGYNFTIMLKNNDIILKQKSILIWVFLCVFSFLPLTGPAFGQADSGAFTYGGKDSCEYYRTGDMPLYRRSLPIASDDPMRFFLDDDAEIPYEYGYVYRNFNDYYTYDWITRTWSGTAPLADAGVLIGGNAGSRLETRDLDADPIDFSRILPYASLYIEPEKLGFTGGSIEFNFYSDQFAFNSPGKRLPRNITIGEGKDKRTAYRLMEPGAAERDWMGIVYTGGIGKTIREENGSFTETLVQSSGTEPLFTVRYREAVQDRNGERFDLLLSFTRVTLVAEEDVEGALAVMESGNFFLAPLLSENGNYTVTGESAEGVRIGVKLDYDYRIENKDGVMPEGVLLFSVNDLDNPSMAPFLETDADWGVNEQGNDFRWAESFGVVRGAASFAVLPYYNHTIPNVFRNQVNNVNGDTSLVRVSRMKDIYADGTANGLLFSANVTTASGYESRNDGNTAETGVSLLLYPEGTLTMGASVGRRGSVSIPFFTNGVGCKIEQSASKGGRIWSMDASFREDCALSENFDAMKVVGSGADSVHYFAPDADHRIYQVKIDDVSIPFDSLQWSPEGEALYEITESYGNSDGIDVYRFLRDEQGVVSVSFENIQDAHAINVIFLHHRMFGYWALLDPGGKIAVIVVAAYLVLVLASVISWRRRVTR